ncbi:MAG: hypothetical protein ACJATS_000668 [Psychroserpens sp.]|jgi:hypothetical protein
MRKVVLKWDKMSVPDRIKKVRFVIQKMTENSGIYPNPSPSLADLTTQADALAEAEAAASDGGKDRTQTRDIALAKLVKSMDLEVLYVQTITLGDPDLTTLAGMDTKGLGSKWPLPEQPQGFIAKPGEFDGSVYMKCDGTQYKKQYVFEQMMVDENAVIAWKAVKTQGRNIYLLEGLERGKIYTFRVYAINSAGAGPVSISANSAAS